MYMVARGAELAHMSDDDSSIDIHTGAGCDQEAVVWIEE
jgi:hypothetical protein